MPLILQDKMAFISPPYRRRLWVGGIAALLHIASAHAEAPATGPRRNCLLAQK
jgi:hypothetical protein